MKKIYTGILAILYLAVSSGVAVELHYCMGDKAGMELYGSKNDKCGKCGMTEKKTGCCHDEYKFYKLTDSQKTVSNNFDLSAPVFTVVSNNFSDNLQTPYFTALAAVNDHAPPGDYGPSACIMNCVFRL